MPACTTPRTVESLTRDQQNLIFAIGILGYLTTDQAALIVARHVKFSSRDKTARRILEELVKQNLIATVRTKLRGLTAWILAPQGVPIAEVLAPGCRLNAGQKPILQGSGFAHRQVSQAYIVEQMGAAFASQKEDPDLESQIFLTEYLRFATDASRRIKPKNPHQKITLTTNIYFNQLQNHAGNRWPDGLVLSPSWDEDWPESGRNAYHFEWIEGERADKKRSELAAAIRASHTLIESQLRPYLGGYAGVHEASIYTINCTFVVPDFDLEKNATRIANAAGDLLTKHGVDIEGHLNQTQLVAAPISRDSYLIQDRPFQRYAYYSGQWQER